MPECYPAYVLVDDVSCHVVGFSFIRPLPPLPTFQKTAVIDYFTAAEHTGKGLGPLCLQRLEQDAKKAGISHIIADVSSENHGSLSFHKKHGFRQCGIMENIGNKLGRNFSVIRMQKDI